MVPTAGEGPSKWENIDKLSLLSNSKSESKGLLGEFDCFTTVANSPQRLRVVGSVTTNVAESSELVGEPQFDIADEDTEPEKCIGNHTRRQ